MTDPSHNDPLNIPEEWPDARPYLERKLDERRLRLERRDDAIEEELQVLANQLAEQQIELHGVRDGVHQLNESFRHVTDQNALLIGMVSQDAIEQRDRWKRYEDEQQAQTDILRDGFIIVKREDRWRNLWRIGLLGLVLIGITILLASKAS